MDALEPFAVKAQIFQGEAGNVLAQKAHDGLFAIIRRQDRHAERDFLAVRVYFEAPVLRQTLFVELEIRQHFDARSDRRFGVLRQNHGVVQNAVDAIADEQLVIHRLDVDVGSVLQYRVLQKRVHDAHDRQVFGDLFQVGLGCSIAAFFSDRLQCLRFLLNDVAELGLEALLILDDGVLDRIGVGQARQDLSD